MSEARAGQGEPTLRQRLDVGRYALLLTLLAIIVVTAIGNPRFFSVSNFLNILIQVSVLGIVAAGQTTLIVSAGLDLSVGAMLSVAGLVAALTIAATGSSALGMLAALAAGAFIGMVNGALVFF